MRQHLQAQLLSILAVTAACFSLFGCSNRSVEHQTTAGSQQSAAQNSSPEATPTPATVATTAPASQPTMADVSPVLVAPPALKATPYTLEPGAGEKSETPTPAPVRSAPTPAPPRTFTLAAGRSIPIYTSSTLSTKSNKSGGAFTASLASPIVDGQWVIARKGAPVEGIITDSDPGGRVKGVASISLRITRLTLADGRTVAL